MTVMNTSSSPSTTDRSGWPDLLIYLLAAFLLAGALQLLQPLLPIDPVVLLIVQFAPALAVLLVALRQHVRQRQVRVRIGLRPSGDLGWRLGVVVAATAGPAMAVVVAYALLGQPLPFTAPGSLTQPLALIVIGQFVGSCGEEIGWRCFLQPYLQQRIGVLGAGVLVGLIWTLWHPQMLVQGIVPLAGFTVSAVAMSVFLAVLLARARSGQLLLAGTFHTAINLLMLLLLDEENGDPMSWLLLAGSTSVVAVIAIAAHRTAGRRRRVAASPDAQDAATMSTTPAR